MARAELTVQNISRTGLTPLTLTGAATDGHAFNNNGERIFLFVRNGYTSPVDITIQTGGVVEGLAIADRVVSVTNGTDKLIGAFPSVVYDQVCQTPNITKAVLVDSSVNTSVSYAAVRLPAA